MSDPIAVRVPASTSNVGAGFDCLGIALDLYLTVRLHRGSGDPVYRGTVASLSPDEDLIATRLRAAGVLRNHRLEVTSGIPISRGLGSSAAALAAAAAIRQVLAGGREDREAIFRAVAEEEGHPDNAAPATFGGARLIVTGTPLGNGNALTVHPDIAIALAVPDLVLETKAARARLPNEVPRTVAVAQAGRAAALVLGLATADPALIRAGMDDQLAVPFRAALIPGFGAAVEAAENAGAWGATISGAGSTLLALAPRGQATAVAQAMVAALGRAAVPAVPLTPAIDREGLQRVR